MAKEISIDEILTRIKAIEEKLGIGKKPVPKPRPK
jgi:hypothetical protein